MADDHDDRSLRGRDLAGIGGMLAGAVVVGLVVGLLLDDHFRTSPTWTLVGLGLGVLAGIVAFWVRVRSALR